MKVELKTNELFKPFDLTISVESREEAQALFAIFNHVDNASMLPTKEIYQNLQKYDVKNGDVIVGSMKKEQWYK